MTHMRTTTSAIVLAVLLAGCTPTPPVDSGAGASSSSVNGSVSTGFYVEPQGRYSIPYPASWQVEENNVITTEAGQYTGTAFIFPEEEYAGTTLTDARIHVAFGDTCPELTDGELVMMEDRTFTHGTWSDVGAGNLYKGEAYTREENGRCAMVTLQQHLCNLGPDCGPEDDEPFANEAALQNTLRMMASNLTLTAVDEEAPVACTKEAKICPDGSAVGRTGPNCEFAPCPGL